MAIPKECKRLVEVDFPLVTVSNYSAIEKDKKTGTLAAVHVWWARRPMAACRAMNLACLLPDPADPNCPTELRKLIATALDYFERKPSEIQSKLFVGDTAWSSEEDGKLSKPRNRPDRLRKRLMKFIGEYSNWDVMMDLHWSKCAREMVIGCNDGNPMLLDPFAGGGSIPLEGMRIGAETYATDLNPIPVLLNKLQLEYLPRMDEKIFDDIEAEAQRINNILEEKLDEFYPIPQNISKKQVPIGYLCARTVRCEGVDCGVEFPLLSSPWVVNSNKNRICYTFTKGQDRDVIVGLKKNPSANEVPNKTVSDGNAKCPICGHKTPASSVKRQFQQREGGANDSLLLAVVDTPLDGTGRLFRLPDNIEIKSREDALKRIKKEMETESGLSSFIPKEEMVGNSRYLTPPLYGTKTWADIYTPRQLLTQAILAKEISEIKNPSVKLIMALTVSKFADRNSSMCIWSPSTEWFLRCFGIQTIQMTWDFYEPRPYGKLGSNWNTTFINVVRGINAARVPDGAPEGHSNFADAQNHPMLDDQIDLWATDPPYYDSVPYADISNYFVVWLKRMLPEITLENGYAPREKEVVMDGTLTKSGEIKNADWYEDHVGAALKEGRRVTKDNGIAYWIYAHKSTEGWSTVLKGIINAGWKVTGSWPISTERATRLRAQRSAALETSVHIVMRPREENAGIGDWADILGELPGRINSWLQRLTSDGIYGADAIFACIGPAMELYSRWNRVEKADGTDVPIDDYLKIVWDTVATEAMKIIDPTISNSNVEDDARFSMMVLWTLRQSQGAFDEHELHELESSKKESKPNSSDIPFDTASLLARGIGSDIDKLKDQNIIEMKKKQNKKFVCLLSPAERRHYLLGISNGNPKAEIMDEKGVQLKLGEDLTAAKMRQKNEKVQKVFVEIPRRESVLDQLHQAMLLHSDGNTAALDNLIKDVIGNNQMSWKLAQTFNTLYPEGSWERSKIEGVIDRYKSIFKKM